VPQRAVVTIAAATADRLLCLRNPTATGPFYSLSSKYPLPKIGCSQEPATACQLQPVSYSLPATACQLQPVSYSLPATACQLQPVSYSLPATACQLQPASCSLSATACQLQPASYSLPATACQQALPSRRKRLPTKSPQGRQ